MVCPLSVCWATEEGGRQVGAGGGGEGPAADGHDLMGSRLLMTAILEWLHETCMRRRN